MKFILSLVLLLTASAPTLAQKWDKMSDAKASQKKHLYQIYTEYDKFKDRTTVQTEDVRVYGSDWDFNPLEMSALYGYPGYSASKPGYVLVYFESATRTWRFLDLPIVLAIADGQRIALGQSILADRKIHTDRYSVSVRETLVVPVPCDTFLKLATASSVQMQVGAIEFTLKDKHLASLREFASGIASR